MFKISIKMKNKIKTSTLLQPLMIDKQLIKDNYKEITMLIKHLTLSLNPSKEGLIMEYKSKEEISSISTLKLDRLFKYLLVDL